MNHPTPNSIADAEPRSSSDAHQVRPVVQQRPSRGMDGDLHGVCGLDPAVGVLTYSPSSNPSTKRLAT